jgi:hypothetical protein
MTPPTNTAACSSNSTGPTPSARLGSQDVNGSLREHCPESVHYIGLDVMPAKSVDIVIDPGGSLPLATDTADAIVSSSAFEHDVCFWDTFL